MIIEQDTPEGKKIKTLTKDELESLSATNDKARIELFQQKYAELSIDATKIDLIKKFLCREVFW